MRSAMLPLARAAMKPKHKKYHNMMLFQEYEAKLEQEKYPAILSRVCFL